MGFVIVPFALRRWAIAPGVGLLFGLCLASPARAVAADFARDIKPLFEKHCVNCHGPSKKRGGFRVDSRAALLADGDEDSPVIPGKADESVLFKLISSQDADERMPPSDEGPALSAEQRQMIKDWINSGADWPQGVEIKEVGDVQKHWAFVPPTRPAVPEVKQDSWVRNPIDAFVLAPLEAEGLQPGDTAKPLALLRRLYLDLVGLPPTLQEVDAFERAPGSVERRLDKTIKTLLSSPHHGERWGREWLDAARYADSNGFEKDKKRNVWFYRDWVVDAINSDMPYDRFITEQIAGDLLPKATTSQTVATGFLRNAMLNEEGGVDPEQFRVEGIVDRMDAIGRGILGVTVACAQCHNHKYDPISQEDYYRIYAFLNNDDEAEMAVYEEEDERKRQRVLSQVGALETQLMKKDKGWLKKARALVAERPDVAWTPIAAPFIDITTGGQKYLVLPDKSFLGQGFTPTFSSPAVEIKSPMERIGAFQVELMTDANLPLGGPGRSYQGLGVLTEFAVSVVRPAKGDGKKSDEKSDGKPEAREEIPVKFAWAAADFESPERFMSGRFARDTKGERKIGPAAFAIDGDEQTGWDIHAGAGRSNVSRRIWVVPEKPLLNMKGVTLKFVLAQRHGGVRADENLNNDLGRFRISVSEETPKHQKPLPLFYQEAFKTNQVPPAVTPALFSYYRDTQIPWARSNRRIDRVWQQHPEGTSTLVLQARPGGRQSYIFKRGDWLQKGKDVSPGLPAALTQGGAAAPTGTSRLDLAGWLVSDKAPTTARTFVNRVWQSYFGYGLVATPEDLGTQGEAPSHPALLDWLAVEFMEKGWSMKHLHRLIVESNVYRQDSQVNPKLYEKDPYNRLLARGSRYRVSGEVVRDLGLAASGLLNRGLGGRPVMPPAPAYLFEPPVSYAPFPWLVEPDSQKYRRSLYVFRRRSTPFPFLQTFDTPSGETTCVRRVRSNTPMQALMTLNESTAMSSARALGGVMLASAKDDTARLTHGFRRVLTRQPDQEELQALQGLLDRQRQRLSDGWSDPWLVATGTNTAPEDLPEGATPRDLAAFTIAARAILNLDESITRE